MGIEQSKKTLDKVISDIEKRQALNAKREQKINDARDTLVSMGLWDAETDKRTIELSGDYYRSLDDKTRGLLWDLGSWIRELKESEKKLKELEAKRVRAEERYQRDLIEQGKIDDLPPILRELKDEIFNKFYGYEMKVWNEIREARAKDKEEYDAECERVGRFNAVYDRKNVKAMFEKYGEQRVRDLMYQTEADIRKACTRYAEGYVMNLIDRVTKYIGQITDYSGLYLTGPSINGIVVGERGRVRLETILAGGWNIQCLHNRELVEKI